MEYFPFDSVIRPWLGTALSVLLALVVGTAAWHVGSAVFRRLTLGRRIPALFIEAARSPGLALIVLILVQIALQSAPDVLYGIGPTRHVLAILLISAATWLAVTLTTTVADAMAVWYPSDTADNLQARRILTQTRMLTRMAASVAVLIGIAFALLTFPGVRNIGASLLASAGLAGLVVGIAARPILGNLLAGLQIALTQPIRIDDVVVVEGEWGRIEDIGRAFVTIAIWDQRRLVVPLEYFINKPFQNWTRATSEILGTVLLYLDYTTPIEPLRRELRSICERSAEWDHRVCLIQVTDASERAMQIRALVSAADASRAWDLRCKVREHLVAFVQENYPGSLPHVRMGMARGPSPPV